MVTSQRIHTKYGFPQHFIISQFRSLIIFYRKEILSLLCQNILYHKNQNIQIYITIAGLRSANRETLLRG